MDEYQLRRSKLAAQMRNQSVLLIPAAETKFRNSDAEYPFRQDSNFYYLTGFSEPEAVLVLSKDDKNNLNFILFNRASDPVAEVWVGKRAGQDGAKQIYHADASYSIADIDEVMPRLLANMQAVYTLLGEQETFDLKVIKWLNAAKNRLYSKARRDEIIASVPNAIIDAASLIHEMRLIKSDQEIAYMRKAAEVSATAHLKLMRSVKSEMFEYQLEAIFNEYCLSAGCRGFAYNAIVASGNNACTLHYNTNDQPLQDGDLVLVDAGAEYLNYASDITRTFPVSGKFSEAQKQLYNIVLEAQLAGIEQVKPGNSCDRVQEVVIEIIVTGLVKLGILNGDVKQLIKDQEYRQFYMHGSGHWLGLDVHDVGRYKINNQYRKFEPGMVVTVEPGIYIANTTVGIDPKWLGIGIRIEDDVLVTKKGNEVLSAKAPKQIEEIESAIF